VLWAIAHNLTRAAGCLAGGFHALAITATIRAHLIGVPARLARSAAGSPCICPSPGPGDRPGRPCTPRSADHRGSARPNLPIARPEGSTGDIMWPPRRGGRRAAHAHDSSSSGQGSTSHWETINPIRSMDPGSVNLPAAAGGLRAAPSFSVRLWR
jgi:hypothetical protein